jgi:hypothetical protein
MLYKKVIFSVYYEYHTKHVTTLCGQNAVIIFMLLRMAQVARDNAKVWQDEGCDRRDLNE